MIKSTITFSTALEIKGNHALVIALVLTWIFVPFSLAQQIPANLLQEDFQIMRSALEQAHGGIYRYTSKAEMNRTFARAYREINRPMTDLEFWRLVAPVVAHIKCGHTFLSLPQARQEAIATTVPLFPLEVRVLDGRAWIYQDLTTPGSRLEGGELLSINGVRMKQLLRQLRGVITGDGNPSATKDWRISHIGGFTYYLYGLGISAPFQVGVRGQDGKRENPELPGLLEAAREEALARRHVARSKTNADLEFLDKGQIAILTIRHWYQYADPGRKVTFSEFLQNAFRQIGEKKSECLIIDVRDNDGGLDAPGKELFSFLWNRPFNYYTELILNGREFDFFKYDVDATPVRADIVERRPDGRFRLVKHPNLGLQQPSEPHFSGKVFALMNGGSFSTSCEFLSMLHFYKRGTFFGSEPAGGYYGCTAGRFVHVTVPNSKLILRFGLTTYYKAVSGYEFRDRGVLPDHPVHYTISDLMAGRDKEMDLALSLARRSIPRDD